MYYKNLLIGIAALTLAVTTALADCTDPNDPNCTCTNNCGPGGTPTPITYPSGSLVMRIAAVEAYSQTNTSDVFLAMTNAGWSDDGTNMTLAQDIWIVPIGEAITNKWWRFTFATTNTVLGHEYLTYTTEVFGEGSFPKDLRWPGTNGEHMNKVLRLDPILHNEYYWPRDVTP